MHVPAYAYATIRAALPAIPTSRQVEALDCCLCASAFDGHEPIPLGPTESSGLFACRPCLTRFVARARRARDHALVEDAERARAEEEQWTASRAHYLDRLCAVRRAADAVAGLASEDEVEPLEIAWLLVSLESSHDWTVGDAPTRPASMEPTDTEWRDQNLRISLAMIAAREAVASRLAYHLINEASPLDDSSDEVECTADCHGEHGVSHIDCGPDEIFDSLTTRGIAIERPDDAPHQTAQRTTGTPPSPSTPDDEQLTSVLEYLKIDSGDTKLLINCAAVGLVAAAWRTGPLEDILATADGPSDGEMLAQSVDLYRRARTSLIAAKEKGPEALSTFQIIASDVHLRWAGGSNFTLSASGGPLKEFVEHVETQTWHMSKLMRERGWRGALLHGAAIGALRAPAHFGMPGWNTVVKAAVGHLAVLEPSDVPEPLQDRATLANFLLDAPDELGVKILDWMCARELFDQRTE
ncbi:hypothetical protein [Actinomadura flavalba]|uniref:hypothetical protein n=1 Tax=Actinomadura flavalba TaxID=1120938 RepID=UPI000366D1D7|nr:hypothetical protein [Actinomadura flavalba]